MKSAERLVTVVLLTLLILGSLILTACRSVDKNAYPITTVEKEVIGRIQESSQLVFRSSNEFLAWQKENQSDTFRSTFRAPKVDFTREIVLVIHSGQKPTGGFSVEIVSARLENDRLEVSYTETEPAKGTMVSQSLTSPYHAVRISRNYLEPTFLKVDHSKVEDSDN
jgi:hypothetical protein